MSNNKTTEASPPDNPLGLNLKPGDSHYRAYVGPPQDYDLIAALAFNLLTNLGLRQHHKLLDVGCGSLRIGRLLIPYLNPGNYTGIDPNQWLIDEGIAKEVGRDQVEQKRARFFCGSSLDALPAGDTFDFVLAHSIFSHCGRDLFEKWLYEIASRLGPDGRLIATFKKGSEDCSDDGWIYPECVFYTESAISRFAEKAGLAPTHLDWKHPRQQWVLFSRP